MFNFKRLGCVLATATITFGIVYLLVTNLVWYYALLGYFGVGIAMFVIGGLYELWDKKRNPWRSYHQGTIFDWWMVMLPLYSVAWFFIIYILLDDLPKSK